MYFVLQISVPLGGMPAAVSVQGKTADDTSEKDLQRVGPFGRNAVPCFQISIADALLGVGSAFQNILGDTVAVRAILFIRFADGLLIAGKKQLYDLLVGHDGLLSDGI